MTRDQLCSLIAERENKKSSVSIGNIREVIRILIQLQVDWQNSLKSKLEDGPLYVLAEEAKVRQKKTERKSRSKKKVINLEPI